MKSKWILIINQIGDYSQKSYILVNREFNTFAEAVSKALELSPFQLEHKITSLSYIIKEVKINDN